MPLTRDTVTAASRVMLPTYVAFFTVLGVNYIAARGTADASPPLAFANDVMPLPAWGGMFLGCALLMASALLLRRRLLYRFALRMCALSMLFWAAIIAAASWAGDATPFAAAWPAFAAAACIASDRSLAAQER
jgi:hypothetical protein